MQPTDLAVAGAFAITALLLAWWIYRGDRRRDILPPPSHHTKRNGPEAAP